MRRLLASSGHAIPLAIVFAIVAVSLSPLAFTRGLRRYAAIIGRFLELNVALLVCGSAGNVLWVALARNKMYVAADPVVEWFAFIPYSSSIYDYPWGSFRGHLIGTATDAQLRLIWGIIAITVWAATWLTLRIAERSRVIGNDMTSRS